MEFEKGDSRSDELLTDGNTKGRTDGQNYV